MKVKKLLCCTLILIGCSCLFVLFNGCAQIGAPTGGDKDTIPPYLVSATPALLSTNFKGNKIVFVFDEYIDVQDLQNNLLVSPFPKVNPSISFKLKTVTVKLKDTLKENTTYAINFGNAIRDNNEGNPFKNFTYVFSTGKTIDSLKLSGQVILAETGKTDSTIIALLYKNAPDSAVKKRKPDYIAKLDAAGSFVFTNLAQGNYKLYALKDGDGGKTYNSAIEVFGFLNDEIVVGKDSASLIVLYASAEEKEKKSATTSAKGTENNKAAAEKKFRYSTNITAGPQNILDSLDITFTKPVKNIDLNKIILSDSTFKKTKDYTLKLDSTKTILTLKTTWQQGADYKLIIAKDAVTDTTGKQLAKTDTISFITKKESDYGSLLLRFTNLNLSKHPVLLFLRGEDIVRSVPITATTWSDKLVEPGEYELRVLYDDNNNGIWDPGNFQNRIQPEKGITLDKKLNIKSNWDNERDIQL